MSNPRNKFWEYQISHQENYFLSELSNALLNGFDFAAD